VGLRVVGRKLQCQRHGVVEEIVDYGVESDLVFDALDLARIVDVRIVVLEHFQGGCVVS